jgi:flagellar basal-body rod protein FlgG
MIRSLWISKTGLDAQQTQMDVISNNLANVSTNGFKRQRAVFQDLLYQTIRQPGAQSSQQTRLPSGLQIGTGVRPVATESMFTQGNLNFSGNAKDMAINGDGFFQIMMPDGRIAYTRDGAFQTDNQGQIVTASGYLLEPVITVPIEAEKMTITRDGIVTVTMPDTAEDVEIGRIQLADFINPAGLEKRGENLFYETASSGAPTIGAPGENGLGNVWQQYVETSNVNVVEELVTMIQTQRAYEINSKSITTSDQMLAKLAQM